MLNESHTVISMTEHTRIKGRATSCKLAIGRFCKHHLKIINANEQPEVGFLVSVLPWGDIAQVSSLDYTNKGSPKPLGQEIKMPRG